jgi:hypothetical protein
VLTAEEMLVEDAASDRSERRAQKGYIASSDAAAFFKLAEMSDLTEIAEAKERDPITRAYFRELQYLPRTSTRSGFLHETAITPVVSGRIGRLLGDAGIPTEPTQALPEAGNVAAAGPDRFRSALSTLAETHPASYDERMRELAYLSNIVIAKARSHKEEIRPLTAVHTVLETCIAGLDYLIQEQCRRGKTIGETQLLRITGADKLFLLGQRLRAHTP